MPVATNSPKETQSTHIPCPKELEKRAARYRRFDFVTIAFLAIANLALAVLCVIHGSWYSLFISLVLFVLSYLIHLAWVYSLFKHPKAKLTNLSTTTRVGRYSAAEIYLMLHKLLAPYRGKEQPNVYITQLKYDGAYVFNSLCFNFIKPLNAVYISQHLFSFLRPDEIKAILAHELAHFYKYIRPLNRTTFLLMGVNALLPLYLASLSSDPSIIIAVLLWLGFSIGFNRIVNAWLQRTSRDFEYLCDLEAARRYGIVNLANGLFGVTKTAEIQAKIYRSLLARIEGDRMLSLKDFDTLVGQCEQRLAASPVNARTLSHILKDVLGSSETKKLRKRLSPKDQTRESTEIEKLTERLMLNGNYTLIDWKRFDSVIPDGRINRSEYERLIRTLESSPEQQLFDLPHDNPQIASRDTHPTTAQRILFLEQARQHDPSIQI